MVLHARNFVTSDDALGGSSILRSLRYGRVANTYLARTNSSNGNRKTWTYSFWMKRTVDSTEQYLFYNGPASGTPYFDARFEQNSHELQIADYTPAGSPTRPIQFITNRKFRDPSSWYHIICIWDKDNGTTSQKMRVWVNGEEESSFAASETISL